MTALTNYTLADVCEALEDGDWIESKDQGGEDFRLLQVSNIGVGDFVETGNFRYITEETYHRLHCREVLPGQILISRMPGPIGRAWLASEMPWRMITAVDVAIAVPNDALVSPRFLTYLLNAPTSLGYCEQRAAGATRPRITRKELATLPLLMPPRLVQTRIADILSAYDDLIENNRRRMALLEEAARQLYREWFVRLRFPGHEHTRIAKGVPEGWERRSVEQLTSFLNRGIAPHYDDDVEGLVINQKCIRRGRLDLSLARRQSREFRPERQVQLGDVLVNSTGEGTLGRVAQVLAPIDNCTVDTHVTIARPAPGVGIHYFGQALIEWEPRFSTMGRGATNQTELSRSQVGDVQILVPQSLLMQQFEDVAAPCFRQVCVLMEQNEKLRAARDLLLPRLMSGEIVV